MAGNSKCVILQSLEVSPSGLLCDMQMTSLHVASAALRAYCDVHAFIGGDSP